MWNVRSVIIITLLQLDYLVHSLDNYVNDTPTEIGLRYIHIPKKIEIGKPTRNKRNRMFLLEKEMFCCSRMI